VNGEVKVAGVSGVASHGDPYRCASLPDARIPGSNALRSRFPESAQPGITIPDTS